jgi:hypothetical protein
MKRKEKKRLMILNLNSYCFNTIFSFFIIYVCHYLLLYINKKAIWFQLHFIINVMISILTYENVLDCLNNPMESNNAISNSLSAYLGLNLHLYHTVFFKLRSMDIYHHITSVFLCAPICLFYHTKGLACYLFFNTGFPGGIDYFLLSLVKNNYIQNITEKKINSYLNAYIRMPGGLITSYLIYKDANLFYTDNFYMRLGLYFLTFTAYLNSTYFGKLAIENYMEKQILIKKNI